LGKVAGVAGVQQQVEVLDSVAAAIPHPAVFVPVAKVENPDLKRLLEYWKEKRGERAMPARADISPHDLKSALKTLQLFDVIDGGEDFHVRIMGGTVSGTFDFNPNGHRLSEHAGSQDGLLRVLQRLVREMIPLICRFHRTVHEGLTVYYTSLFLPLGENDEITQILGQSVLREEWLHEKRRA
jgi:hypothetical protein